MTKNIPQLNFSCCADCYSSELFLCGHIRRMVNSRAALIPHSTLLPLVFDSTKDVLVSRSSAISAPLSSAKHKFTAHSCTGWGFLLLQCGRITTMLFCSVLWGVEWLLQKASTPPFHTDLLGSILSELTFKCLDQILYDLSVLLSMAIIWALTRVSLQL